MNCNYILGIVLDKRNIITNNFFKFLVDRFRNNKIKPLSYKI